jgi:hypothetical protein
MGYTIFQPGRKKILIIGQFGAQKVPKCSKVARNSFLGAVLRCFKLLGAIFAIFNNVLPILVDLLPNKRFLKWLGGTFFRLKKWLNSDLQPTILVTRCNEKKGNKY